MQPLRSMTHHGAQTTQKPAFPIQVHKTLKVSWGSGFPLENRFHLWLMLVPKFTFFDVSREFLHKLLSFHPVDDWPPVFAAVAEKGPAVQAEWHT